MSVRPIITYPSKVLRQKCKPFATEDLWDNELVTPSLLALKRMMEDMEDTLEESDRGAALAANQVGFDYRIIAINQGLSSQSKEHNVYNLPPFVINPQIIGRSQETEMMDEACLSFPNFSMSVRRHKWVEVAYETILFFDGTWHAERVHQEAHDGFWAQVFQHEIDHLDGKLFVDVLPEKRRIEIANHIVKNGKKGK